MPYDVRMPDGTVIRNVPDGTTKADIQRRYDASKPDTRPKSFWQGVWTEGASTANRALKNMDALDPFAYLQNLVSSKTLGSTPRETVDAAVKRQAGQSKYQGSSRGKLAGGIADGLVGTIPTFFMGGPVAQGAAGGLALTDDTSPTGLLKSAAIGAAGGKLGEQFGKRVVAPIAERIGRTAPARAVSKAAVNTFNGIFGSGAKQLPLPKFTPGEKALPNIPAEVAQNLADAARLKLPYAPVDASPELRALGGSVARFSPQARGMAEQQFGPRSNEQAERAISAVRTHLSPTVNVNERAGDLIDAGNTISGPLYTSANQGGSMAPLQAQLETAFGQSSKAVSEAQRALAAAQNGLTVSKAGVQRAGNNVYMNASALPEDRAAQSAVTAAEQRLAAAQAEHAQVTDIMRRAQGDAASGAPGAIWSPRIQQFIDDPIAKSGLSRGVEIQRLEALAAGKPFDPTELAITGADEAGNPVVSGVPNMRTLDALKKGLDNIIDDYPKDFRGNPILDQRGRAVVQVKKALLENLDEANPDYAAARGQYAGWAQSRDALRSGYDAPGRTISADDVASRYGAMEPPQQHEYALGYASKLVDDAAAGTDRVNPYTQIVSGLDRRAKLDTLFPQGAEDFARTAQLEDDMARTYTETVGGSATQPRSIADAQFAGMGPDLIAAGVDLAGGGGAASAANLARRGIGSNLADRFRLGMFGSQKKADELAPILFNMDPKAALAAIEEISRKRMEMEARKQAYQNVGGLLGLPAAVGAVSTSR